ncbi:hypothetical protein [Bartonella sp. CR84HXZ]|uniref:hypothetical protein n=1 Tax=Bartonella sp. CR84HXZ TaxID=1460997 RepID=UPI0035D09DF0
MQTVLLFLELKNTHEEDILAAAKATNALELIQALPDSLDTQVGERGTMLSGNKTTHRYCTCNSKKCTPVAASRHHHYICQLMGVATALGT